MYSCKVVVFGQKWLCSGKCDCIKAKVVVFDKVVIFGQSICIPAKVIVFRQKWMYPRKVFVLWQKLLYSGKSG